MKPQPKRLSKEYAAAMSDYLAGSDEEALRRAAELGRSAISEGLGVLELVGVHQDCLSRIEASTPRDYKAAIAKSRNFLAESLSSYEIALRSSQETTLRLQDNLKELRLLAQNVRRQNRRLAAAYRKIQVECRRYRELFDLAPDGYVVTDTEGVIREANRAAAALLRVERHRLRAQSLVQFVAGNERKMMRDRLKMFADGAIEKMWDWQVWLEPEEGVSIATSLAVDVERRDGEVYGLRWLLRDITQRLRMGEERAQFLALEGVARAEAEAARRFEILAEASSVLSVSLDWETSLTAVASLAASYFAGWCFIHIVQSDGLIRHLEAGFADGKLQYTTPQTWKDSAARVPVEEAAIRDGIPDGWLRADSGTYSQRQRSREIRSHCAMLVPLIARGRKLGSLALVAADGDRHYTPADLALANDLARRCALALDNALLYGEVLIARDNAEKASRAKDDFLAILSHELKNPLTPVLGWARFFKNQNQVMHDPVLSEGVQSWERNARHISRLVDDCLDLARISERRIQIDRRLVDLNVILSASAEALRARIVEKQMVFSLHLSDTPVWVMGDSVRLKQVFMNLLTNAIKYTAEKGLVSIRATKMDDQAEVEIRDTGVGIAASSLEVIFEPFRRGTEEWLRSESSLGIGLAISRQILEMHGGHIRAESDGPGLGSCFRVKLPQAASGHVEAVADQPKARPAGGVRPSRILLIEDSHDVVFLMTVELERLGHSVVSAADGAAGLELAKRERPSLIISDIKMPGMDGYELIRKVRATPPIARTPAIALTGFGMKADVERALASGYDACLCKPADPEDLIALIDRFTGEKSKPRSASSGSHSG